jgi:hypothetical protein
MDHLIFNNSFKVLLLSMMKSFTANGQIPTKSQIWDTNTCRNHAANHFPILPLREFFTGPHAHPNSCIGSFIQTGEAEGQGMIAIPED